MDAAGRAWFCDWNWLCHGPAWFDLATLLLTAYAGGLDADALFARHPAAAGAPPDALDVTLAALSGYFLTAAGRRQRPRSPHLPAHQRWSGEQALAAGSPAGRAGPVTQDAPALSWPDLAGCCLARTRPHRWRAEPFWLVPGDLVTWPFAWR